MIKLILLSFNLTTFAGPGSQSDSNGFSRTPTNFVPYGGRALHQIQEVFHVHDDHSLLITPNYSDFTKLHSTISYFLEFQFLDSSDSDYSHIYGRLPIPTRGVRKFPTKPLFLRCLFFFQVIFLHFKKKISTQLWLGFKDWKLTFPNNC